MWSELSLRFTSTSFVDAADTVIYNSFFDFFGRLHSYTTQSFSRFQAVGSLPAVIDEYWFGIN